MGFLGVAFRFWYSLHTKTLANSEDLCWTFTCDRDEKRKKTDPSFKPSDARNGGARWDANQPTTQDGQGLASEDAKVFFWVEIFEMEGTPVKWKAILR